MRTGGVCQPEVCTTVTVAVAVSESALSVAVNVSEPAAPNVTRNESGATGPN